MQQIPTKNGVKITTEIEMNYFTGNVLKYNVEKMAHLEIVLSTI